MMLEPLGLAAGPVVPTREWRELYAALDGAVVAAIHPFYTASLREFTAAGRPIVGSAPVGYDGTAAWLAAIGAACSVGTDKVAAAQNRILPAIKAALTRAPISGRITGRCSSAVVVTGPAGHPALVLHRDRGLAGVNKGGVARTPTYTSALWTFSTHSCAGACSEAAKSAMSTIT